MTGLQQAILAAPDRPQPSEAGDGRFDAFVERTLFRNFERIIFRTEDVVRTRFLSWMPQISARAFVDGLSAAVPERTARHRRRTREKM
jgi:hypothetical protein